jgi:hypothetical protein
MEADAPAYRVWPPIVAFSQQLVAELGHPVQANAYITPPSSRGFAPHYDVHDLFVLQVAAGHFQHRLQLRILRRTQPGTGTELFPAGFQQWPQTAEAVQQIPRQIHGAAPGKALRMHDDPALGRLRPGCEAEPTPLGLPSAPK